MVTKGQVKKLTLKSSVPSLKFLWPVTLSSDPLVKGDFPSSPAALKPAISKARDYHGCSKIVK